MEALIKIFNPKTVKLEPPQKGTVGYDEYIMALHVGTEASKLGYYLFQGLMRRDKESISRVYDVAGLMVSVHGEHAASVGEAAAREVMEIPLSAQEERLAKCAKVKNTLLKRERRRAEVLKGKARKAKTEQEGNRLFGEADRVIANVHRRAKQMTVTTTRCPACQGSKQLQTQPDQPITPCKPCKGTGLLSPTDKEVRDSITFPVRKWQTLKPSYESLKDFLRSELEIFCSAASQTPKKGESQCLRN